MRKRACAWLLRVASSKAREDKTLDEANWKWLNVKANHDKLLEIIESWKVELLSCSTRLERLKALK